MTQSATRKPAPGGKKKSTKKKKRNTKAIVIVAVVLVVVLGLAGFGIYWGYGAYQTLAQTGFYPGVTIDGIDVAGMSEQQAIEAVNQKRQSELDAISIPVVYNGEDGQKTWTFTKEDLTITTDTEQIVAQAMAVAREGEFMERLAQINHLKENGQAFTTSMTLDAAPMRAKVDEMVSEVSFEPEDAEVVKFDPDAASGEKFIYKDEKQGQGLNGDALMEQLTQMVESRAFSSIVLEPEVLEPKITRAELEEHTKLVVSFTSTLTLLSGRTTNVTLASDTFHGLCLKPGEQFSLNEATGERTKAKGYQDAMVIKNGTHYEPDTAGGVCQVSTNLYNAAVRAGLQVDERHRHSIPASYVPLGQDAAVSYPYADFKFTNNTEYPIYLAYYISDGKSKYTVEIYGTPLPDGQYIKMESTDAVSTDPPAPKEVVDNSLAPGARETEIQARVGKTNSTYKVTYDKDGNEIEREYLHKDVYPAIQGVYRVGPSKPSQTPQPSQSAEPTHTSEPTKTPKPSQTAEPTQAPPETTDDNYEDGDV
ncbi:MAG: VanW family protein [Christensenellales bacterium]|jgi:vancomycin resistance protein YoaR